VPARGGFWMFIAYLWHDLKPFQRRDNPPLDMD
jgi:hypothetical protein